MKSLFKSKFHSCLNIQQTVRILNAWHPLHWHDFGKNKSTRHKDVTRLDTSHTRQYMFTHKMTHVHTQDNTCPHTRWHIHTQDGTRSHTRWHVHNKMTHIHKQDDTRSNENAVLFSFMSFQILLFLYVINKQGKVSFNLSQFLSHIMPFSIKHFEFSSVHVIYSMVYPVSALLSCFQYWVNFLYVMNDICTLGRCSKDCWLWQHIPYFL